MGLYRLLTKSVLFVISIFSFSTLIFSQDKTIAVIEFDANMISKEEAKALTDRLQIELFNIGGFRVMERGKVDEILKEQGFQVSGCISSECLVEAGRLIGIEFIVGGSISKIGNVYSISARMIEVETGEIRKTALYDFAGDISGLLTKGMREVAVQLTEDKLVAIETETTLKPKPSEPIEVPILETEKISVSKGGGIGPCLATCCIGPRVGLEINEGKDINTSEWIMLGGQVLGSALGSANSLGTLITLGTKGYMAYDMGNKNGFEGILASYCIGPRVGNELDYRRIRNKEWLLLIPCVNIYPAISIPLEAYRGKTMTEIEIAEGLRK